MSEIDERLLSGEEVVFRTSKHWAAPVADSGTAVLLILGSVVLAWLQTDATEGLMGSVNRILELLEIGLFLGGLGWIAGNIVSWRSAEYAVTNQRVLGREGLVRQRSTDTLLTTISDVGDRSSAIGRRLSYGDIRILSASGESGADTFTTVRDADGLKKQILEQKIVAESTARAGLSPSVMAAAASTLVPAAAFPPPIEVMTTLAVLANIRDAGTITTEEFEAKKTELLARI